MKKFLQQWPILIASLLLISGASAATLVGSTGRALGALQPDQIDGLQMWLSADSISASDGDTVATWADQSGNGNGMAGEIGPVLHTDTLNGHAVLDFTTTESFENTTLDLPSTWTILYIARMKDGAHQRMLQGVGNNWLLGTWSDRQNVAYFAGDTHLFDQGDAIDESWHMYEGSSDGTTAYLYSGGQLIASSTSAIAPPEGGLGLNTGAFPSETSDMQVAEVIAYDSALSDSSREKVENYLSRKYDIPLPGRHVTIDPTNGTTTVNASSNDRLTNGLIGHWSFDGSDMSWSDATDGSALDSSEGGHDGTLSGFSQKYSPIAGRIGQALHFDGSSYVATSYTVPAQNSSTSFTWSTWAKLDAGNTDNAVILGFRQGDAWIKLTPTKFEYADGATNNVVSPPIGQWVNITIVKSGTTITYYVNGAEDTTDEDARSTDAGTFYIGEDPSFADDGAYKGALDDVRIYDRALSPAEVRTLYLLGR